MATKPIYARIAEDLYNQLQTNKQSSESLSSATERLIKAGIEKVSSQTHLAAAQQQLGQLKDKVADLEKGRAELQGSRDSLQAQLQTCKTKEWIALAAQSHVVELQQQVQGLRMQSQQLQLYLQTPVATCNNCHNQLALFDIGQAKCRYCGSWGLAWLPGYAPPPTKWEIVKDGAAAVGAVAVVSALLNALSSSGGEQHP